MPVNMLPELNAEKGAERMAELDVLIAAEDRKNAGKSSHTGRKTGPIVHGTDYAYTGRSCRCPKCRGAHAQYARKQKQATPTTTSYPVEPGGTVDAGNDLL